MKKLLILLFSFLISFNSYGKIVCIETNNVETKSGVYYLPNDQEPFTGENQCVYNSNGQYHSKGNILNGLKDGRWTIWYENSQIMAEVNYKDGKEDGKWTMWYENGQIKSEVNYKDGKLDGKWTNWYENGQIMYERNFKYDEFFDGKWIWWYEDGQKRWEANYKYGKLDGKFISWHENGQKLLEGDTLSVTQYYYDDNGQIERKRKIMLPVDFDGNDRINKGPFRCKAGYIYEKISICI